MTYTLTLLGTDTQFSPGHVENAYDKAETLSYVSTLIEGDPGLTDGVTEFRNTNVAVVDGPTTLGSEVGDRIARGVQAVLEAISRGETDISIIAHSRGAVEAILVAHELERIKELLKQPGFDRTQLTNSVCGYTKAAMTGHHREVFASLNLERIAENIGKVKISMLNIDPVPGGNYMGVTRASSLAWQDPRFYVVPKIVKEYEQYIYENERTRCFKPIVPKCASSETRFKLQSLPGHHGTGSGNLLDQQRKANPTTKTTEHVQELVIVKIIDFLKRHGVSIKPKARIEDPFAELIAQFFESKKIDGPLEFKEEKLKPLYLDLFSKIMENREAYQHFNTTSYAVLGQEQAIVRRVWRVIDQRIVHHQDHNDTFLDAIVPPLPGGHFLNYEHARLYLNHELGLREGMVLNEIINQSVERLIAICRHTKRLKDLKDQSSSVPFEPSVSLIGDKIAPTLESKEGFNLLLEGLAMLIEEVKQPYLQGTLGDFDRGQLYESVKTAFTRLKEYQQEEPKNELTNTILVTLNSNLEATLETKRKGLEEHYRALSAKLKAKDFFNTLQNRIKEINKNLETNGDGKNGQEYLLSLQLNAFLDRANTVASSNPTLDDIRVCIQQAIQSLSQVEKPSSPLGEDTLALASLLMNEALDDSVNYELPNLMREVILSHNELDKFKSALPDFQVFYSALDYDKWQLQLEEQRDHMVYLAAEYIVREGFNLETVIKPLFNQNEALYKKIEGLAIGLGAENPLVTKLDLTKFEVERIEEQHRLLTLEQQMLTRQLESDREEHDLIVQKLNANREENERIIKELVATREKQAEQINTLQFDVAQKAKIIDQLQLDVVQKAELVGKLQLDLKQKEALIKELTSTKEEQAQLVTKLRNEKSELQDQFNLLKEQNIRMQHVLNDYDAEFKCQSIVKNKLEPLTKNYLIHLIRDIKKSIDPTLNINDDLTKIITNAKNIENWPQDDASKKLKQKFDAVSELYQTLRDSELNPSEKVTKFYTQLNDANEVIKEHREPDWKRYTTNAVAVLGIILTGILPGLAVLAIAAAASGKSARFWESSGQTFFKSTRNEIENNVPDNLLTP